MKLKDLLSKITQLPWKDGGRAQEGINGRRICAAGFVIGDMWFETPHNYAPKHEQAKANTTYLVHAVNVLPELVAAMHEMKSLGEEYNRLSIEYPAGTCNSEDAWNDYSKRNEIAEQRYDAALARAEMVNP